MLQRLIQQQQQQPQIEVPSNDARGAFDYLIVDPISGLTSSGRHVPRLIIVSAVTMDGDSDRKRAASSSPKKTNNKENENEENLKEVGTVKRAAVNLAVKQMFAALATAVEEKDPNEVKSITFTMTPVRADGEVLVAASDPVFEAWKKQQMQEENSSDDDSAEDFCVHCNKSPCVWVKNEEQVKAIVQSMEGERNLAIRFQLYGFFTKSLHGVLGKGNRIPLPTCCGRAIRSRFPCEEGEVYTGFKPGANKQDDGEEE